MAGTRGPAFGRPEHMLVPRPSRLDAPTDLLLASAAGGQLLIQKLQLHGILIGGIQIHHDVGLFPMLI
jgi:hypothetical protein